MKSYKSWDEIAAAILRGEFNESDTSTFKSLVIGLRDEPKHEKALKAINKLHKKGDGDEKV